MVVDVLVAIPPTDITETLIQGTGEEDHVPHMVEEDLDHVPHMLGGTITVVTVGRTNQFHYSSDPL